MTAGDLITANGQVEWAGMLFGDGVTTFMGDGVSGWEDLPGIDSGDVARPSEHGAWAGSQLAQERLVQAAFEWRPGLIADDDGSALRAVRMATTLIKSGLEQPLVIRLRNETLMAFAKVTNRSLPNDHDYSVGVGKLQIQWTCSDPRRYGMVLNDTTIALPIDAPSGLTYPLVYPLDYGTQDAPPEKTLINAMDADAPVQMSWTGPMANPVLTNLTTGKVLGFNMTLASTDVLAIDTAAGTVLLNGTDRLYQRTAQSSPVGSFTLAGGPNDIVLRATSWDVGNGVEITWRDATF